ncbi:MAG: glycosyltransferase [Chitinophagaceae bacterium]
MDKTATKISVVVCTYNGAGFLDEQLASILQQDYPAMQVVISDDCSTDNTWDGLVAWQAQYPGVIEMYRQPENLGYNKNFAFALSKVKGDYVALCDQDDIWYPHKLATLVRYAVNNPDMDMLHHDESELGKDTSLSVVDGNRWLPYEGSGCGILFVYNRLTGHKMFFKKRLLEHILPIPDGIVYDWWINVVVGINGKTLHVPEALMAYRLHAGSAYFSDVKKQIANVTVPLRHALRHFDVLPNMSARDRYFVSHFLKYYERHTPQRFDARLFLFLLRNRYFLYRDYYVKGGKLQREIFIIRLCRAFSKW